MISPTGGSLSVALLSLFLGSHIHSSINRLYRLKPTYTGLVPMVVLFPWFIGYVIMQENALYHSIQNTKEK